MRQIKLKTFSGDFVEAEADEYRLIRIDGKEVRKQQYRPSNKLLEILTGGPEEAPSRFLIDAFSYAREVHDLNHVPLWL